MKKFLATLIALFLGVSLAACSNSDVSTNVLSYKDENKDSIVTITHSNNKVLKIESTLSERYDAFEGGRSAVEQQYGNAKNNNPFFDFSIEYGEDTYKIMDEFDLSKIDFKQYINAIEFLGLPISDSRDFVVYDKLVEQYVKEGFKEKKK